MISPPEVCARRIESAKPGPIAVIPTRERDFLENAFKDRISEWFPTRSSRTGLSVSLVGLHVV